MGALLMFILFAVTYNINYGTLGFFKTELLELPETLYGNLIATFLGFTEKQFFSADYFSIFPWTFLYFTGYFLSGLWRAKKLPDAKCLDKNIPFLTKIGKKSLIVYMLHQPILYILLELTLGSCNKL